MIQLPPPQAKPTIATVGSGTIACAPLGEFEITYTFVDKYGRHSKHSPPVTINVNQHWHAVVRTKDLHIFNSAVCYCVWWKRKGESRIYPMGGMQFACTPEQVQYPYLPFTGWVNYRYRGHFLWLAGNASDFNAWPDYSSDYWHKGSYLQAPAIPLEVRLFYPPKHGFQAAWSWATDKGETGLSPVIDVEPVIQDERYEVRIRTNEQPRNGHHGRYLYFRESSNHNWKQQQSANGEPYWPLHTNAFTCQTFDKYGVPPAGGGSSTLCQLQLEIEASKDKQFGHIEITENQYATSPVVVPYSPNQFYRTISGRNGQQWILEAQHAGPAFLEGNQRTRLVGCWIRSATATAGIDFFDTSGGGAFYFRAVRCRIDLYRDVNGVPYYQEAYGIGCMADACARGGASEPVFTDCEIAAYHPVVIEGTQSANWIFENLNANGGWKHDSSIITLNSSNHVTVRQKFTADQARALCSIVSGHEVDLEHVWIDQGIPQWFVVSNRMNPSIRCHFTRAHNWYSAEQQVRVDTSPVRAGDAAKPMEISGQMNLLEKVVFDNGHGT